MARDRDGDEGDVVRPSEQTNEEKRRPRPDDPCACGKARLVSGRCSETGLWPRYVWRKERREKPAIGSDVFTLVVPCPYACAFCGGPLEWHGGCYHCQGSVTPWDRDTWTFPGDRYERDDDCHWEKVDGPHPACTPGQNRDAAVLVNRVRIGELTVEKALEELPFRPVDEPGMTGKNP